jgi:hypothetical protein
MRAMNGRIILTGPNHTYFGKWGRIIDTDEVAGRWLVAIDLGPLVKREQFRFTPR